MGDADKVRQNIERFSKRNYLYDGLITSHEPGRAIFNLDAILSFPRLLMGCWCLQNPDISNSCPPGPSDFPMVRSKECVFMVGTHWTSAGKQADLNRLPFTLLLMRLWNGHTMG